MNPDSNPSSPKLSITPTPGTLVAPHLHSTDLKGPAGMQDYAYGYFRDLRIHSPLFINFFN